ncbi:MAG TPA: OmpW family outer membrane protein, partial [Chromobacteriaceae bacterium]|nr:OmpW family outer membrane protein [Chromobacteriaceae bacterium]
MKKLALAAMIGLISASAFAAQGDILARFRVINVNPDVSTSNTSAAHSLGLGLSDLKTDVKDDTVPELDFTYMITNNIGAELILGTSRHKVDTTLGNIGKVSVLPPTLTLQYHFAPEATFRPYAGVGVNYT